MVRALRHPGPPATERIQSVAAHIHRLPLRLKKGLSLNESITDALTCAGFQSGYVQLSGAALDPLKYVIPAPSPDNSHVAWYSETYAPAGRAAIEQAGAIVGLRDGAPFVHCHGIWRLADGSRRMGHLLPLDSVLAENAEAEAWAVSGARFEVRDDSETGFRLFAPMAASVSSKPGGERGFLCTIRPNEDVTQAVEQACRRHGISRAAIRGIGSLVGADLSDGTHVPSYATEVLIGTGKLQPSARCELKIALVDMEGRIVEGRLAGEHNPVCVTFELLIEETTA